MSEQKKKRNLRKEKTKQEKKSADVEVNYHEYRSQYFYIAVKHKYKKTRFWHERRGNLCTFRINLLIVFFVSHKCGIHRPLTLTFFVERLNFFYHLLEHLHHLFTVFH